ncbi:MAG TPA: hypothetical protein P5301_04910 [Bacteroidales bacterium]|nr:hypothetical protein [Bacteroidales bacterium]HRR52788.1 hypothetical protein [Bacteroidales bacterium]HRS69397.1 hypothetical protein [Bacteroidales bacterium]
MERNSSKLEENVDIMANIVNNIDFGERNIEPVIEFLLTSDFIYAPASKSQYNNYLGGLFDHSLLVFKILKDLNKLLDVPYGEDTIFIVSFLHDLYKTNCFTLETVKYNEGGSLVEKQVWKYEDNFPIGQSEKTLFLIANNNLIELTEDEILALRWFRGSYEVGNVLDYQKQKCYLLADAKCPLIRLLSAADISAIAIERQKTMEYDISKFGE